MHLFFFFFFQAEDGIRDYKVTGVQTCALPILSHLRASDLRDLARSKNVPSSLRTAAQQRVQQKEKKGGGRSEERRVGKEGRWRRWTSQEKKEKGKASGVRWWTNEQYWCAPQKL